MENYPRCIKSCVVWENLPNKWRFSQTTGEKSVVPNPEIGRFAFCRSCRNRCRT